MKIKFKDKNIKIEVYVDSYAKLVTGITNFQQGRPAMTRTGPDDARRVVWALGEFFLFFLHQ